LAIVHYEDTVMISVNIIHSYLCCPVVYSQYGISFQTPFSREPAQ